MSRPDLGAGLEGRGILVTGAAGGIGRATADLLARCGARIMAVDLDEGAVTEVVAALPGEDHVAAGWDLADPAGHESLITTAVSALGSLWCLAHLAGVLHRQSDLTAVSEQDWDRQLDVNLKATFFLCRAAAEAMREHGGGSIVTFSSQGAMTGGFGGSVVYNTAKGGVITLTRGLARTYGPHGVRVNCVAPGQIETPMLATGLDPVVRDRLMADTPLGRLGRPAEVAPVVVFLASDHAAFVSGATVNVSGGFLMY
jgi:NAD(P)-dependent dehydrogenase (short-subunit alcohol dehydrogenase family)